ncbi:hypothetical protein A0H81_00401 [Grifola frondosa]|uniref:Uncharacterized protein n=1 Tax=Grifola frondosa TaxID=5627 RepID=A0A1C7MNW0_GRIFR|nr:hypothetical protein A0H81_00401 [Grifola frondosa]
MASALRTLYDRRGFPVLNSKGEPIRDAFRRGLGYAIQCGGDIHVAADAMFSQRHNVSAGECLTFYDPEYFISKEQVDRVGKRIEAARKKPPKQTYKPRAPDAAVDECEKVHEAADEKKEKTSGEKYDDRGLMALLCRHDIVLFYANVDTPGEQQNTQRSIDKYDILPEHIANRLVWATSIMHAYGHQWSCQLAYNPRLREGFGLTDGEGCERHWSRNHYLIGVTRTSARSRRIWILDRHAKVVNQELRSDLGIWIRKRLKTSIKANEILSTCGISVDVLQQEWASQRAAQLSVRAHAPARLKKELDLVLNLQGDLDVVDKALETHARLSLKVQPQKKPSTLSRAWSEHMQDSQTRLRRYTHH